MLVIALQVLPLAAVAQQPTAERAVQRLVNLLEQRVFQGSFTLHVDMSSSGSPLPQEQDGTFTLQGDRLAIDMDGFVIRYDGKTLWSYLEQNNEVSVSEPLESEMAATSPLTALKVYSTQSHISYADWQEEGTLAIHMQPKGEGKDFRLIVLHMHPDNYTPTYMRIEMSDGTGLVLHIAEASWKTSVPASTFAFDTSHYPDIYVNDLR